MVDILSDAKGQTADPARIGLCLSGGGFRAMLFHAGAILRLGDAGVLSRVELISGVSGGAIVAAMLGLVWPELDFERDRANGLRQGVVEPLRRLADVTIDRRAVLGALIDPKHSAGERVAAALRRHLFGSRTLRELPDTPTVIINATNVQSLAAWRFSKQQSGDSRVGLMQAPAIEIATAVAASMAYAPFLSPITLRLHEADFLPGSGADLQYPPFTTRVTLADAASIDSLGISAASEECEILLVSDALRPARPQPKPPKGWIMSLQRTRAILEHQLHDLRVGTASGYCRGTNAGAYWEIGDPSALKTVAGALVCPNEWGRHLPEITSRLRRLDGRTQEELINWGYAIADASLRTSFDPSLPSPTGFPYSMG